MRQRLINLQFLYCGDKEKENVHILYTYIGREKELIDLMIYETQQWQWALQYTIEKCKSTLVLGEYNNCNFSNYSKY